MKCQLKYAILLTLSVAPPALRAVPNTNDILRDCMIGFLAGGKARKDNICFSRGPFDCAQGRLYPR